MPTIELLAERVAPVSLRASVAEVYNWFASHPDALALPVVEEGRPVGLIDRQDFLLKLAEPLGHSRYGSRPIAYIMDQEPAVVEYGTPVAAFSEIVLKSSAGTMMRGFIVTRKGQYFGVGTVITLLHLANQSQTTRIAALEDELRAASSGSTSGRHLLAAKADFVAQLTRELSAPLQAIGTFVDMVSRHALVPLAREQVTAIGSAAAEGLTVLDNARDLVALDSGALELNGSHTLLRTFVDEIASHWTARGQQDGVAILVSYEGDTELVANLDRNRFRKTVDALVEHSLSLVRNGIIEVGLKADVVDGKIRMDLRVRDDGLGLDPVQIEQIAAADGTAANINMTMAIRMLKLLGGRFWAENNDGRGTTYGFEVEVERAWPEEEGLPENVALLNLPHLQSRPHVLIADDNTTNRVVAQALCEMFGCTCDTAEDGRQALDAVAGGRFDMVLMDIKMPRMDGVQATRAIHALPGKAELPIVALTANADPDDAASYIAAGMLCVVEKPIKPERLRMAMTMALSTVCSDSSAIRQSA